MFKSASFEQKIKSSNKNKNQTVELVKAEDFYEILFEMQIRPEDTPVDNLSEYLQLSPSFPDLFKVKQITKTLDAMQQNEKFMQAIQDDLAEDMENDDEDYHQELDGIIG